MIDSLPLRGSVPLLALLCASPVVAQWSSSPASNLAIADGISTQDQSKLAPTSDGGCYVSWFDSDPNGSPAFGYDVRLQRLDAAGRELWPHGGVLVADRGFSSTQDYGLDVDSSGNAVLAFRDDRLGGIQVTAAKFSPSGTPLWGSAGVQLTSTTEFLASPKLAGTTDGHVVVAWTQGSTSRLQRLDAAGAPTWASDVILTPPANNFSVSDLRASDHGAVILAMVRSGGFTSPRHLLAQKLDATGALLWGASHVAVFDGGSLQLGNFPTFVTDGSGGAVFGWYSSTPALECRAQRVLANGTEAFVHNGVAASSDATQRRVSPSVAFEPQTQRTVLVYTELNGNQSQAGVSAQSFDATGTPQWGGTGLTVQLIGAVAVGGPSVVLADGRATAAWTAEPGFGQTQVFGARLDLVGSVAVGPFAVSSTPATKYRLQGARSVRGFAIFTWRDETSGNGDIRVQNVLSDGRLGGVASATSRNGTAVNPSCFTSATLPAIGTTWTTNVAHAPTTSLTATVWYAAAATGPVIPSLGELLVDVNSMSLLSTVVASTGTSDAHALGVPIDLGLVGFAFTAQALTIDNGVLQLCNAIDAIVGL